MNNLTVSLAAINSIDAAFDSIDANSVRKGVELDIAKYLPDSEILIQIQQENNLIAINILPHGLILSCGSGKHRYIDNKEIINFLK